MILIKEYENKQKIYQYKKNIELKINDEIYNFDETNKHFTIYKDINRYDFYSSIYDKNYNIFKKYKIKNIITIGNNLENDIYIQDSNICEFHITINTKTKTIINNKNPYMYINNKRKKIVNYTKYDLLTLLNLKVIIHDKFIMINSCINIFVHLENFNDYEKVNKLKKQNLIKYFNKEYREINDIESLEIKVDKKQSLPPLNNNTLILSIGPAITMSIASLFSASIYIYNAYYNGRDIFEVIPIIILPLIMIFSTLFWVPIQRKYENNKIKNKIKKIDTNYIQYINQLNEKIDSINNKYIHNLKNNFIQIDNILNKNIFWKKQKKHNDFLKIKIGIGKIKSIVQTNNDELNEKYYDSDIIINLSFIKILAIIKTKYDNDNFILYILLQLISYYAYDEIKIILLCDEQFIYKHNYFKNINHFINKNNFRYIATNKEEAIKISKNIVDENYVCIVFNMNLLEYFNINNMHIITYTNNIPHISKEYIKVNGNNITYKNTTYKNNEINKIDYKKHFSEIINYNIFSNEINSKLSILDVYDINTINKRYLTNEYTNSLNIIIGKNQNDNICLDIHESGEGPHGLIAGTTGSGKSEFIITLVLSLCMNYSPNKLQIVLIDFKGGSVIQSFENKRYILPHLVGTISNLEKNELLRSLTSFKNECLKRQNLFKKAAEKYNISNINIDTYRNLSKNDTELENIAHLLIIVDEFAELKKSEPEFMSDLISISRIGRSLGVHLILSTQKPSGIIDEQIWSNCGYKVCLKVQEKQDSLDVIKCIDAINLKNAGSFYLLSNNILKQGQCAFSNDTIKNLYFKKVELLDNTKSVINQFIENKNMETQISKIMNELVKYNNVKSLWLKPINELNCKNFKYKNLLVGIIDDFYNRNQYEFILKQNNIAIFSNDNIEKINFINTYLYALVYTTTVNNQEIYIIDCLNYNYEKWYKIPTVIDILNLSESEKIFNLFKRIENIIEKNIKTRNITIIINNINSFKERYIELIPIFKKVLNDLLIHKINFVVVSSNYSGLTYQEHSLINEKIILKHDNISEISSILEINTNKKQLKKQFGLIKKENLLEFRYININNEDIFNIYNKFDSFEKLYKIPYMPKNIPYSKNDNIIGISYDEYKLYKIDNKGLIVSGIYEENINDYISKVNIKFKKYKNYEDYKYLICSNHDLSYVVKNNLDKPVLWIAQGYISQYVIPIKYKDDLNDNEAIYYYKGKVKKIKLI